MSDIELPPGFQLGVATSAWQIEGDLAGRGRNIWDDFADRPGSIVDGARTDPACDHIHRLDEDLDLLGWLGVDVYRFSISWARLIPEGSGALSPTGVDFYNRLIDGLLERGISPSATLFHWDLPSPFEAAGGWPERDTAYRFADYAQTATELFGDRVDQWATLNEPWCSAFLGYCAGYFAPGRTEPGASLAAAYHLTLGHGLAVPRMREAGARNVGIALNIVPAVADDPTMEDAASYIEEVQNGLFLEMLAGRGIPPRVREACADLSDFSFVRDEDRAIMAAPIDWVGENYYTVMRVGPPGAVGATAIAQDVSMFPGCPPVSFLPRGDLTDMGWEVIPEGLERGLRAITDALPGVPLWITENGVATQETTAPDGTVHDPRRIAYLQEHLRTVSRLIDKGFDLRGYYEWSLMDNLEWASGWTMRFGIIHVDQSTGMRTPKDSARWYRDLIAARD